MVAIQNVHGLYEIAVLVKGRKRERTLRGLIDTGSTDCVCTYQVITTLQIRPIDFTKVTYFSAVDRRSLIYEANVGFDDKSLNVPIVRVQEIADDCHFILGMSVLSKCSLAYEAGKMQIDWSK